MPDCHLHAQALEAELAWLEGVAATAMRHFFAHEHTPVHLAPPDLPAASPYAQSLRKWNLSDRERLVVALALAPHVRPHLLDRFLIRNADLDVPFSEFGGHGGAHRGFWPTAETACFLLAADVLNERVAAHRLFDPNAPLRAFGLLQWDDRPLEGAAPRAQLGQPLQLGRDALSLLAVGRPYQPSYGGDFPAQRIDTPLDWDDLVLAPHLRDEVEEIRAWIEHRDTLLHGWGLERRIKPGFRTLFHGPPGTGKSLTAALLGKKTGRPVYRIDLSMVVSKYIGETEKNLSRVFDQAERQDWILFFDEADALFGRRSGGSSANDRFANQEVAYLLQRIEDFSGVAILASNLKGNIDDAFARRFQSMLHFPMPGREERVRLWQGAFAPPCRLAPDCVLDALAGEFELSGGAIVNVLRYAALACVRRGGDEIRLDEIRQGARRELRKDGRVTQ
jgi:hypothetical protein